MSGAEAKKLDSAHRAMKRYLEVSKDATTLANVELVKNYQQLLEEQWVRFSDAQENVEIACGDENTIEEEARVKAEEWYLLAKSTFNKTINSANKSDSIHAASATR